MLRAAITGYNGYNGDAGGGDSIALPGIDHDVSEVSFAPFGVSPFVFFP
jgi:hypothetical protein